MRVFLGSLCLLAVSTVCVAAEEPVLYATPEQGAPSPIGDIFSEFRLGGFAHQFSSNFENNTVDVNGEVLFVKPLTSADPWIDALLPRPHIGATLNLGGKTSHAYAGLTWTVPLGEKLFIEGSFGASVNNASTERRARFMLSRIVPRLVAISSSAKARRSASTLMNAGASWAPGSTRRTPACASPTRA